MKFLEFILILVALGALALVKMQDAKTIGALEGQISSLQAAQTKQTTASVQAAGAEALSCADRVARAVKAGATIARISAPRPRAKSDVQSMFSAQDIRDAAGLLGAMP